MLVSTCSQRWLPVCYRPHDLAETVGSWIAHINFVLPTGPHATALPLPTVPLGIDPHWEMENRTVWNEESHTNEVHEFVYEVSWIPELLLWRRFLRTHRVVSSASNP